MSQRMTLEEVLREYGIPQIKLDVHAKGSECRELREKLMDIVNLSGGKEQGYLDIDCKLYIDIDDIDRYLSGELDTLGEI
ncbi:MAG: hypothetical protein K6C05_09215, partial [Anaerovibrio sp.]|uniref:hypothetical protein n=1 Tax=Anaerovibrio sp. TaxID=1872532 RepID=UPI0025ECDCE9